MKRRDTPSKKDPLPPIEAAVALVAFVAAVLALAAVLILHRSNLGAGVAVRPPVPAMDFALVDQRGERFALASGKVIVLTFLYTPCTDECPFTAEKLKAVYELLTPGERKEVELVVVSSDPVGDTVSRVAAYSKALGMYDRWHYVVGDRQQLEPIWKFYDAIAPAGTSGGGHGDDGDLERGLGSSALQEAGEIIKRFGGGQDVEHPTTIWLIDRKHDVRLTTDASVAPSSLAHDIIRLPES